MIDIFIQARLGSSRLPKKVLYKLNGHSICSIIHQRLAKSSYSNNIVFLIPDTKDDDELETHLNKAGITCFRGSEKDVLSRFFYAAKFFKSKKIMRITADCPLIDPALVDSMAKYFIDNELDYYSNVNPPTYPDGFDVEIFSFEILREAHNMATSQFEREHVTPYIREYAKKTGNHEVNSRDLSNIRLTLDYNEDYLNIKKVFEAFGSNIFLSFQDVENFLSTLPKEEILKYSNKERNIGAKMSTGQKIWERAKQIIPGGTMLLSKNPDLYLPTKWPVYYKSAKGCKITDYDGIEYLDFSSMGIGTNTLGYANDRIDNSVIEGIKSGNMSTLLAKEEVLLAEKLLSINPWASKVRFARTGGEANAIAIRIARAFTENDNVAICGYHGWHDWYLAGNLKNPETMEEHLIKGLLTKGVPQSLKDSTYPFFYNDFDSLQALVENKKIGVIKMEVERFTKPDTDYLRKVRKLADDKGIVLIFDECTSAFRETFGGLHKKYDVIPDIAMYGKALGNGYAVTAVVGKDEIMNAATNTFISSTFWTERIGSIAGLTTLDLMEEVRSWETLTKIGNRVQNFWHEQDKLYSFGMKIFGFPALCGFEFKSMNQELKTYITQEMLKHNILATNVFYASLPHEAFLDQYFESMEQIFRKISQFNTLKEVTNYIEVPISKSSFSRLN